MIQRLLGFDILENGMGIVSLPHFVYDFSTKMLYSIKWSNFIFWLPLLLEISGNKGIVTLVDQIENHVLILKWW